MKKLLFIVISTLLLTTTISYAQAEFNYETAPWRLKDGVLTIPSTGESWSEVHSITQQNVVENGIEYGQVSFYSGSEQVVVMVPTGNTEEQTRVTRTTVDDGSLTPSASASYGGEYYGSSTDAVATSSTSNISNEQQFHPMEIPSEVEVKKVGSYILSRVSGWESVDRSQSSPPPPRSERRVQPNYSKPQSTPSYNTSTDENTLFFSEDDALIQE